MEKEEIVEFYVKVLTKYTEALTPLKNDNDLSINDITRSDLDKEAIDVYNLITYIRTWTLLGRWDKNIHI